MLLRYFAGLFIFLGSFSPISAQEIHNLRWETRFASPPQILSKEHEALMPGVRAMVGSMKES